MGFSKVMADGSLATPKLDHLRLGVWITCTSKLPWGSDLIHHGWGGGGLEALCSQQPFRVYWGGGEHSTYIIRFEALCSQQPFRVYWGGEHSTYIIRFAAGASLSQQKLPEINIETLWQNVAKSLMPPEPVKKKWRTWRCFKMFSVNGERQDCNTILADP